MQSNLWIREHVSIPVSAESLFSELHTQFTGSHLTSHKVRVFYLYLTDIIPGFPHSSVGKESTCNAGDPSLIPGLGRSAKEGIGYPLQYSWASLVAQGNLDKESACNAGDLCLIPGLGRSPGEGKSYPLQYYGLENSMDCIVQGVTKSWTRLSDFHFTSQLI